MVYVVYAMCAAVALCFFSAHVDQTNEIPLKYY